MYILRNFLLVFFCTICFGLTGQYFLYKDSFRKPINLTAWAIEISKQSYIQQIVAPDPIILVPESNRHVPALFFNRKSDKVLIVGQGFGGNKEDMLVYATLFTDYDVICFDYRWNCDAYFFMRLSTLKCPIQSILLDEQEEIVTVVNFLKSRKQYKEIVGLGLCYSAALFVIAQVNQQKQNKMLFTKIICDSMWLSIKDFIANISLDPYLPLNPQMGGCPNIIKNILKWRIIRYPLLGFLGIFTPNYSLDTYLSRITDTPLLFIHGFHDLLVPLDTFKEIWYLTRNTPKAACITPYQHSSSFINQRVYKALCTSFIDHEYSQFIEIMDKNSHISM